MSQTQEAEKATRNINKDITFNSTCADPDNIIFGSIIRWCQIMNKRINDAISTTSEKACINIWMSLLNTFKNSNSWILLIGDAHKHLKLPADTSIFAAHSLPFVSTDATYSHYASNSCLAS